MKPNMNYGLRPVTAAEIVKACGSAARALEITGGDEQVALLYINNVDRIATAEPAGTQCLTPLGHELREMRNAQIENEARLQKQREKSAARQRERDRCVAAFKELGTASAVAREIGRSEVHVRRLLREAGVPARKVVKSRRKVRK